MCLLCHCGEAHKIVDDNGTPTLAYFKPNVERNVISFHSLLCYCFIHCLPPNLLVLPNRIFFCAKDCVCVCVACLNLCLLIWFVFVQPISSSSFLLFGQFVSINKSESVHLMSTGMVCVVLCSTAITKPLMDVHLDLSLYL